LKGIYRYIHWSSGESEYGSFFEKADCAFLKKGSQVSKVVLQSEHNNNIHWNWWYCMPSSP
jgi:IS5 family transposase